MFVQPGKWLFKEKIEDTKWVFRNRKTYQFSGAYQMNASNKYIDYRYI
jgi:hypothetical protein